MENFIPVEKENSYKTKKMSCSDEIYFDKGGDIEPRHEQHNISHGQMFTTLCHSLAKFSRII